MRTLVGLVLLATAPALAEAQATKEDLKKLAKAGLSEDVILAYVKSYGFQGRLTADDLVELKDAGIGDKVLTGLLAPAEAAPAPQPEAPADRPATPSGTWSVSIPKVYPSSYYHPVYRPYYTGSISRAYYHRPYHCGYYRPYFPRPSYYYGSRYYGYARFHGGRVCR